jgi:hypothetical protein
MVRAEIAHIRMRADGYAALAEQALGTGVHAAAVAGLAAIGRKWADKEYVRAMLHRARGMNDRILEALLEEKLRAIR